LVLPADVIGRSDEAQAVAEFLDTAAREPAALVMEGEPGVGKTTLWLSALDQARDTGFRVLSARPSEAESVLAYAGLGDMLAEIDAAILAGLPDPQRIALDRILLRTGDENAPTDPRAVAAAFLAVAETHASASPVLLAVDDVQWLDASSAHVLAFAARRLLGQVGLLVAVRDDPVSMRAVDWLQLPSPDGVRRIALGPLSIGALHAVLSERLKRSFSRPTMVRIHDVSGGNPFYAIELARALDGQAPGVEVKLPNTLAGLVQARIGTLDGDLHDTLLATACLAVPTVEVVASVTGFDIERVVHVLSQAENKGILSIEGNRIRFAHPLLATGVYTAASPAERRAMHRRLAVFVDQPELKARHLALSATSAEPRTLESLDAAAESARMRGAPAAAAEFLELAIRLGGDSPERRIRSANHHFNAGDVGRARAMLDETVKRLPAGPLRAEALASLTAVRLLEGSFGEAAALLERALDEVGDQLGARVPLLVTLAFAELNAGELDAAADTIENAVATAEQLGHPHLLSQALSMRVIIRFQRGRGLDAPNLQRALQLEDCKAPTPVTLRPSMQNVLLMAWTGRLPDAHKEVLTIRRECMERGEESELMFVAVHSVMIDIWQGNFTDAALVADDTMERARQLGGDLPLSVALMIRAAVAAYAGQEVATRTDAREALAASKRCRSNLLAEWPITIIGFLEVSMGNYQAALTTLEPMLATLDTAPKGTEIFVASFVPDAIEAMIQLRRLDEAEPLIDMFERNGSTVDRSWMLAVGGRCRSMLLASRGDVAAATVSAEHAMAEHDRLPMPFERARTQLVLGQLYRRQRRKEAASVALRDALATFEGLNTPLWADRVRAELARTNVAPTSGGGLTPSEQQVAELAASGMTYREVAAALFISPKTVEVNLSRIYRKLGIRSRAELGRLMGNARE
jgi:DNA-binding CsgD family transcriptional regulator